MSKKLGLLLAVVLLLAVSAPVFAQGAFSDVPSGHWAYQAVDTLSKAGLIEGYPDGTFKGDRQMTRYEFAMAIARMMQSGALGGKEGPAGAVGPQGPAGAPGGPGLTPEQQALLNRLQNEFAPELKKLREDVDNLAGRVADIEAALARKPKVTIGGDIDFRTGLYGTKLGFGGLATTAYPNPGISGIKVIGEEPMIDGSYFFSGDNQWGAIHFPVPDFEGGWDYSDGFSVPISDSLKDSFKAPQFMSLRTRVKIAANLSPVTSAGITLLADPLTNHQWQDVGEQSPNAYTPNGIMDVVKVDEAYLKYGGEFIRPINLTAGKLYAGFGRGLLFNNSQYPMKAGRLDIALTGGAPGDGITYTLFSGLIDLEGLNGQSAGFPQDPNNDFFDAGEWGGPDGVTVQHLAIPLGRNLAVGGTYLGTGFGDERGWSADISARVFGLDFWGEWAKLSNWACGCDETPADVKISKDRNNTAWVAGLGYDKPSWALRAQYGEVGPTYAFTEWGFNPMAQDFYYGEEGYLNVPFSLLHPNEEFDPHYINWLDRPLFLDPTNVAKGWEVAGTFKSLLGEKTPVSFRYYTGKAYSEKYLGWLFNDGGEFSSKPGKWRDADAVWAVTVGHQFSPDVTANLTYAQRNVDNVMSPNLVEPDQDFFFTDIQDDPIKVVRLDLNFAF
jgi:hypothetical protein